MIAKLKNKNQTLKILLVHVKMTKLNQKNYSWYQMMKIELHENM